MMFPKCYPSYETLNQAHNFQKYNTASCSLSQAVDSRIPLQQTGY